MAINIFTFSGNIGSDGMEVRYTPSGKAIGEMSVASKQGYRDHEKTSWITCKMLGERAEKLSPYLHKGGMVTVSGEFTLEQWEKDGVKHSKPVVIIQSIQLPPKSESIPQSANQAPQADLPQDGFFDDGLPF